MSHLAKILTDTASQRLLSILTGDASAIDIRASDWPALLQRTAAHRVTPLVYSRLRQRTDIAVPGDAMTALRQHVQNNAARALALAGQMRSLLAQFEQANIPAIVFKGIALSAALYGGIAMREVGDLDLLLRKEDISRAADLLMQHGHQPFFPTATTRESAYLTGLKGDARRRYLESHCEHHLVQHASKLNVDLHWGLSLREFAVPLDPDKLWSRTIATQIAGSPVRTPGPVDMLLILCLNGSKDRWERLDRVCDVAALLAKFPPEAWLTAIQSAAQIGMARMVSIGLLLARSLMHAPIPHTVADDLDNDIAATDIANRIRQRLLSADSAVSRPAFGFAFDLQLRERSRDRIRYALAQFRPGVGDWAALPLPNLLSPLHYLIRPFRLAKRYGISKADAGQVTSIQHSI